jgi:hypothetical protein
VTRGKAATIKSVGMLTANMLEDGLILSPTGAGGAGPSHVEGRAAIRTSKRRSVPDLATALYASCHCRILSL